MTFRRILTGALLLFVAASFGTLAVKGRKGNVPSTWPSPGITASVSPESRQVLAYYFVRNVRCSSCRQIEEVSRRTIEASFPRELADGRLRFLAVNVDRPENRRFIEEFRLDSASLILVEMRDGKPAGWKNLSEVWTLVDDPPGLEAHVRDEVAAFLKRI